LTKQETEALLAAPDRSTRTGRRDHALLVLAAQTGLRVSELTSLRRRALKLEASPHLICTGKGRKERACPLTRQTVKVMTAWLREVPPGEDTPLVPGPRGGTLSRDAIRRLVTRHWQTAATGCPSLQDKHITPHTLRHTCAMSLLHAGVDLSTIALWLGHEQITTVQIYLHADLALKEQALAKTNSPQTRPGRYHAPDTLIAFLDSL
jgi:site-specific recombinase XerD